MGPVLSKTMHEADLQLVYEAAGRGDVQQIMNVISANPAIVAALNNANSIHVSVLCLTHLRRIRHNLLALPTHSMAGHQYIWLLIVGTLKQWQCLVVLESSLVSEIRY